MHATLYTCSTAVLLYFTYRPHITVHISETKQQFTTVIYHTIATYMPITNTPLKCQIFANMFMYRCQRTMSVYILHMNSLQSTLSIVLAEQLTTVLGFQVPSGTVLIHVRKQPHQSASHLMKKAGVCAIISVIGAQ